MERMKGSRLGVVLRGILIPLEGYFAADPTMMSNRLGLAARCGPACRVVWQPGLAYRVSPGEPIGRPRISLLAVTQPSQSLAK